MTTLQRQVKGWAEECRMGRLPRRAFVRRVLLIGGSVPVAVALLKEAGISADATEISEAELATSAVEPAGDVRAELLRCSFCNQDQNHLRKLIAGPSVFICDDCVAVCNDIIAEDNRFHSDSAG